MTTRKDLTDQQRWYVTRYTSLLGMIDGKPQSEQPTRKLAQAKEDAIKSGVPVALIDEIR